MKYEKIIVVWSGLFFFVGLLAAAPQASAQSCCDKATALSKQCSHPCCAARYQLGKICFKCNANKATTCCDKREVAGGTCNHPCCQSATALSSVCFKCNPGRTAVIFNGKDLSGKVWKFKGDKGPGNWVVGIAKLSPDNPKTLILETGKADLIKKGQGQMVNLP
ncbi:MAG: hypothetical protein IID32_11020, partial [Planctomycetes bacterium]|nr:hypothetical protein [Planctomycetota bacterium]